MREWQAKLASGRWVGVGVAGGVRRPRRGPGRALHRHRGARARAARPSSSAASASTSSARRCSRTAPTSRRRGGCRRSSTRREIWCQLFSEPGAGSDLDVAARRAPSRVDGGWRAQRPEGVDELRAVRRLGLVPGPHRPRRAEAARASRRSSSTCTRPASRCGRCAQITDEAEFNEVFFADVFVPDDRLVGPRHEGWRVANSTLTHERGVNPRQLVDPRAARRRAAGGSRGERGAFDDHRLAAAARARRSSRCGCSSCTTGARSRAPRKGERSRAGRGSINKLWWSEMSKRLHDTAMAVLGPGRAAVARRRRQPGRRRLAAIVALLPGGVDLGGHQRDPAQHRRRAHPGPPPRAEAAAAGISAAG